MDGIETAIELKNGIDDLQVEYEVEMQPDVEVLLPANKSEMNTQEIVEIDDRLNKNEQRLKELNADIYKLENHADGIDYMVAVGSGIIAGAIDIVFVKDFSLEGARDWGTEKVEKFVKQVAKTQGCKSNDLAKAVKCLEDKFPIVADKLTAQFGGGRQHHLRDFSHHPTPIGLIFSLLTQFTGRAYGTDTRGVFQMFEVPGNGLELIGKDIPQKIVFGVVNWMFHMVSDMAGSSGSLIIGGSGTGLPGPIVSLLKEMAALPIFKKTNEQGNKEISVWISKLFNGTLLKDSKGMPLKVDLRTELGIVNEVSKQALPVVINECIVRGFYFVRRLVIAIKNSKIENVKDLGKIDWKSTVPIGTGTITRMLTIATGTMTAIDLADAAIESAIKSGGIQNPAFAANMVMKVNFVGIGRFAIAVGSEAGMAVKRHEVQNAIIVAMNERIYLLEAKLFYRQGDMWIQAENTGKVIEETYKQAEKSAKEFSRVYLETKEDLKEMNGYISKLKEENPEAIEGLLDILEWG